MIHKTPAQLRFASALLLLLLPLFAGCDSQKHEPINWQVPMESASDLHGSEVKQDMPAWAGQPDATVVFRVLDKNNANFADLTLHNGESGKSKVIEIKVLGFAHGLRTAAGAYIDDDTVENPAVYVAILKEDKQIYRGWLYQEFPELFGADDKQWRVTIQSLSFAAPAGSTPEKAPIKRS